MREALNTNGLMYHFEVLGFCIAHVYALTQWCCIINVRISYVYVNVDFYYGDKVEMFVKGEFC